ncbi:MAG: polysulfide reductase NrfD [Anaerolineales bacterium]|nr:polysulfide reductase NrfD [Anaerolineales bacterium]
MTTVAGTLQKKINRTPVLASWLTLLFAMAGIGLVSGALVFINGLAITNLTNRVPWGLWITVDLSAIALGAGAFSLSAIAYIFRVKSFRKISRMAVYVGLVGYTSAMLALLMDIGRPDRFWHPTVYWNIHSVLWEITMCVILYSSVLMVEFAPILLESKFMQRIFPRGPQIGHFLHSLTPVVAVIGLGLSLLHQSSLGATYGVLVARPIWFKPSMPVMFITSAVAAGATFTLAITVIYENLIRERQISVSLRNQVAAFAGLTMMAYLYLKLWDFLATAYYSHLPSRVDDMHLLESTTPYGTTFWWIEVLFGALLPAVILLTPRLRNVDMWLVVAMLMAVLGIIANRWNVTLSGLIVPMDWSPGVADLLPVNRYTPSLVEIGVSIGVLGYALLMFTFGLRYLPMFPDEDEHH